MLLVLDRVCARVERRVCLSFIISSMRMVQGFAGGPLLGVSRPLRFHIVDPRVSVAASCMHFLTGAYAASALSCCSTGLFVGVLFISCMLCSAPRLHFWRGAMYFVLTCGSSSFSSL